MPVRAAWCGGHCRSDRHGPACEKERWGKRLGMRRDSGQKRLAGGLDADRVSSGDCAEYDAGGLGSPCNVEPAGAHRERWGKRLGMRWDSGRTRLAGVLDADRLSPGDCAEDGAGGLGSPCNVGAGRGPSGKMGQETRPRWRSDKPWARRDSSCGGLSPGDHSATRQGWPVGRPQRSRRSERHPAEKATKRPRVPGDPVSG